jgi:hypothetical protein
MPDIESSSTESNTAEPKPAEQKPAFPVDPLTGLKPALTTLRGACNFISDSPADFYRLLGLGKVKAKKAGKRTLPIVASLEAYVASLPDAKIKPPTVRKRRGA